LKLRKAENVFVDLQELYSRGAPTTCQNFRSDSARIWIYTELYGKHHPNTLGAHEDGSVLGTKSQAASHLPYINLT